MTRRLAMLALLVAAATLTIAAQERPAGQAFSFKTSVELINVTATVTDASGRFVSGLKRDDFELYEDGKPQPIVQFDSERVPVSLGIALDTSGSMAGEKMASAQAALHRFLFDLLGPRDEVFLYRFDSKPELVQPWTADRQAASRALGTVRAFGGTAIYDTVAEAVPMAQAGTQKKKALVIISDGMDTSSHLKLPELERLIQESEVLIYAIGIDSPDRPSGNSGSSRTTSGGSQPSGPAPVPSPFPGHKPAPSAPAPAPTSSSTHSTSPDRVNPTALRAITDSSGGRTEVITSNRDLDPATAGIADELSKQYFLGYTSSIPKDGRWHTIEVRLKRGNYVIRARKGFIAN